MLLTTAVSSNHTEAYQTDSGADCTDCENSDDAKVAKILWYVFGVACISIALAVIIFFIYRLFKSVYCADDAPTSSSYKDEALTASEKNRTSMGRRTGSKSLQIIIKMPSLAESSVIPPDALETIHRKKTETSRSNLKGHGNGRGISAGATAPRMN